MTVDTPKTASGISSAATIRKLRMVRIVWGAMTDVTRRESEFLLYTASDGAARWPDRGMNRGARWRLTARRSCVLYARWRCAASLVSRGARGARGRVVPIDYVG